MSDNNSKTNPNVSATGSGLHAGDPAVDAKTGAKAVGGGLQPGTTDFGSGTAPMSGGVGGAGSDSARTAASGQSASGQFDDQGAPEGGEGGMAAAGGNSVLNTGRPTQSDSRAGIGGYPKTGPNTQSTAVPGDRTGVGTIGGGTAGSSAIGTANTSDITEAAPSAPNFVGHERGQAPGTQDTPDSMREGMRRATQAAREATERSKDA